MMRRRAWLRLRSGNGIAGLGAVAAAEAGGVVEVAEVAVVAGGADTMVAAAEDMVEDGAEAGWWQLAARL